MLTDMTFAFSYGNPHAKRPPRGCLTGAGAGRVD